MEPLINPRIPKTARSIENPNWEIFERVQRPHKTAWKEMIRDWEIQYNFGKTYEERKTAGENLGYSEVRMAVHEIFRPLYWFHGKLF